MCGFLLRWGSGCDGHCDCSNGASCDRLTGFCDCRAGYMGKKCEIACPDGLWGANCIHHCLCMHNGGCNPETGECTCAAGWMGPACEFLCPFGQYGLNCARDRVHPDTLVQIAMTCVNVKMERSVIQSAATAPVSPDGEDGNAIDVCLWIIFCYLHCILNVLLYVQYVLRFSTDQPQAFGAGQLHLYARLVQCHCGSSLMKLLSTKIGQE
ncbi:EGF-like domain protein [Dictyocaulus viviparus]|uniref:EGF-like domain protein n=1 Tax=Dictyocaulus viviparus TaxID=29172 RepID=A0A0D8XFR8_DICVI|nr:EGF-like domain protein [Dictyocaulus viviparus]